MSARKSVYISHIVHAESLPSPNATVQAITAEIRLFYPPRQESAARQELTVAYQKALEQISSRIVERS